MRVAIRAGIQFVFVIPLVRLSVFCCLILLSNLLYFSVCFSIRADYFVRILNVRGIVKMTDHLNGMQRIQA